jgi:hypothetical protein
MAVGFKTPEPKLVLVLMMFSEVEMFLKQMNKTNTLIFINSVLEKMHKYHENYSRH